MTAVDPTPPFVRSVPSVGFVLDADIPATWLFSHRGNLYTTSVIIRVNRDGAVVPACWPLQLAEALLGGERQGLKSGPEVDQFLASLSHFKMRVDGATSARVWSDTLSLARSCAVSVFDAAYLELAGRLGLPLATTDAALRRAAAAAGVPIFVP